MSEGIEKLAEDIYGAAFIDELESMGLNGEEIDKVAGSFATMAGKIESGISRAYNAAKGGAGRAYRATKSGVGKAYKATGAQRRMDNLAAKVGDRVQEQLPVWQSTPVGNVNIGDVKRSRELGYKTMGIGAGSLAAGGLLTAGGIVGVKALKRALAKAPAKAQGIARVRQLIQQHPRAAIGIGAGAAGLTGAGIYAANR